MKVKTAELIGSALDWAVAVADDRKITWDGISHWVDDEKGCKPIGANWKQGGKPCGYSPSTVWNDGGLLIEREGICLIKGHSGWWIAKLLSINDEEYFCQVASTPLLAAMRTYVTSKLGDEIDVPAELTK